MSFKLQGKSLFIVYRKTDGLEVDCHVLLFLNGCLSDVLIVVMWPKWVHKHLQEVAENVFSWEKLYINFLTLLTENISH